jgi:uncharacterized protein (UPF0332 family)
MLLGLCSFRQPGLRQKIHDRTIQQFGLLVRDFDEALRVAGKAFNEIRDERSSADYDELLDPSPQDARDALAAAIEFLAVCGMRYGFRQGRL